MYIGTLLEEFIELTRNLSRADFCSQHKNYFLLGIIASDSPAGELDFYTGVIHIEEESAKHPELSNPKRASAKPGKFLVKIEKRDGNAWHNWYSVGRSKNNDIVIRHPSVSKLHARLDAQGPIQTPPQSTQTSAGLWITDVGSTEGTKVNGAPLSKSDRYPLQNGDRIFFGNVETVLLDAGRLYDILSSA